MGLLAVADTSHAASTVDVACPGSADLRLLGAAPVRCDYEPSPGFHPTHDGGPWLNVDLLHVSLKELQALHAGTSGTRLYTDKADPQKDGPKLPALDLVHAQICLADPEVVYNKCPNNYPFNAAAQPYGYTLNPKIVPLLEQGFQRLREAGLKVVLRFTYNWPCTGSDSDTAATTCSPGKQDDAPMDIILAHMRVLAPTIQRNSDVIYAFQAGFIGRWGEWHNSTNGNDDPPKHNAFLDQFTALFGPYMQLEVRRPYVATDYSRYRFGDTSDAHLLATDLGMHDDEFGSDPTDAGTFLPENPATPGAHCLLRKTMALLGHAYTMTGETSAVYHFRDPVDCGADVPKPHDYVGFARDYALSSLQLVFNEAVWKHWVEIGLYPHILDSIGPHLSLVSSVVEPAAGDQARLTLTLRNSGWARIPSHRSLWLLVFRGKTLAAAQLLPVDLSQVKTDRPSDVTALLPLSLSPGTYAAALYAPDPSLRLALNPRYALLFENLDVPDCATGLNTILSFAMKPRG